jgi:hypothetical protein
MNHECCRKTGTLSIVDQSLDALVTRLRPLLLAVHQALSHGVTVSAAIHVAHGWNPPPIGTSITSSFAGKRWSGSSPGG